MNKKVVLDFIKKNMLSLMCGLVAILAVGATFYPLAGMVTTLQNDATTAAADYSPLQSIATKARNLPTTDPTQTDPGQLKGFPNPATINWAKSESDKFVKASQTILQTVQDMNAKGHGTVVGGAFSATRDESVLFKFAKTYAQVLSTDPTVTATADPSATPPLVADSALKAASQVNIQNDILHGCVPPTLEDIKAAQDDLWTKKYYPLVILQNGVPVNEAEEKAQWQAESLTLGLKLKRATTKLHKMYVEKDAFTINPAITPHDPPKAEDMWYAQMQLWMQRDLAYAIAEENSKSTGILDSPVKRLLKMDIPVTTMYVLPVAAAGQAGAAPPAPGKDTDPVALNYLVSPSGRSSNGMYDVLQFTMYVDVDASKVNEFIETLSHQRLISVNVQSEYALDSEAESRNGYLYGTSPTVRLVLDGEMLFMRSWTVDLMPEKVKQYLGLIPGGTPGMQGGGGMGGPPAFGGPIRN